MISRIIFLLIVIFTGNAFAGEGGVRNPTWEAIRGTKPPKIPTSPPDENGLNSGMGLIEFFALSIYPQSDMDKVASNANSLIGATNPIDRYIAPKEAETRKTVVWNTAPDVLSSSMSRDINQRASDARKYANEALAKGSAPTLDYLKYEFGVKSAFDTWFPTWGASQIAVVQSGSRGQKTWASAPVVGEISWGYNLTNKAYEQGIFYSLSPDRAEYTLAEDSEFSRDIRGDRAMPHVFMRKSTFALFAVPRILSKKIDFEFAGNGFNRINKGDPDYSLIRYIKYDIPESQRNLRAKALLADIKPDADFLAELKQLEEAINLWHFMALSNKGEPIKYAFKAPNRVWVIVTFTENGIVAEPVNPLEEYKVLPQLEPWHKRSKSDLTCWGLGAWSNPCSNYYLSTFGNKKILGAVAWVNFVKDPEPLAEAKPSTE